MGCRDGPGEGRETRDACWAYFKGEEDEAVRLLMSSKGEWLVLGIPQDWG
jgi:hypothetical protein